MPIVNDAGLMDRVHELADMAQEWNAEDDAHVSPPYGSSADAVERTPRGRPNADTRIPRQPRQGTGDDAAIKLPDDSKSARSPITTPGNTGARTKPKHSKSQELFNTIRTSTTGPLPAPESVRGRKAAQTRDNATSMPLELRITSTNAEQFNVLIDGRYYWGGSGQNYKAELRLSRGQHRLRIETRHPLDKEPREFVPQLFAVWLMNGQSDADPGPYVAALDADIAIDGSVYDSLPLQGEMGTDTAPLPKCEGKVTVRLTQKPAGSAKGKSTDWTYAVVYSGGAVCEPRRAYMHSSTALKRRWRLGNYALIWLAAAFGAVACAAGLHSALNGGNTGGGIVFTVLGGAVVAAAMWVRALTADTARGARLPSISFKPPSRKP